MNFFKDSHDFIKRAYAEPNAQKILRRIFLSIVISFPIVILYPRQVNYWKSYSIDNEEYSIRLIKEINHNIKTQRSIVSDYQRDYDNATTEEEKAAAKEKRDLAQRQLTEMEKNRDAIASKVKDKSAIEEE